MLLQSGAPPGTLINRDQSDTIDAIGIRFIDIREHQRRLKSNGVELTSEVDGKWRGARQLDVDRSGRQPDPGRSARLASRRSTRVPMR
jgi:hypothetical protein